LDDALKFLTKEDPSLRVSIDQESGKILSQLWLKVSKVLLFNLTQAKQFLLEWGSFISK